MDKETLDRLLRGERVVIRVEDLDEEDMALIMAAEPPPWVPETLSEDSDSIRQRAARADVDKALGILDRVPDVPPDPDDEI